MRSQNDAGKSRGERQAEIFRAKRRERRIALSLAASQIGVWEHTIVDLEHKRLPHGLSNKEFRRWLDALDKAETMVDEFRCLKRKLRQGELLQNS